MNFRNDKLLVLCFEAHIWILMTINLGAIILLSISSIRFDRVVRYEPKGRHSRMEQERQTTTSSTQTTTVQTLTLKLTPTLKLTAKNPQKVSWSSTTIDNEGKGKKSSKVCCIYHKPRAFDESSSDESSDGDGPNQYERVPKSNKKKCNHTH